MKMKNASTVVGGVFLMLAGFGVIACSDDSSSGPVSPEFQSSDSSLGPEDYNLSSASDPAYSSGVPASSADNGGAEQKKDPDKSHDGPVNGEDPNMKAVDTPLNFTGGSAVIFTEVSPENANFKDNDGNDPGWVELYNTSDAPVSLNGVALSNDARYPRRFVFGNVTVPAKSYMVVFLSGKNYVDYIPPSDSVDMIGSVCETEVSGGGMGFNFGGMDWGGMGGAGDFGGMGGGVGGIGGGNAGGAAGNSAENLANLPGQSSICFTRNGANAFGSVMKVSAGGTYSRISVKSNVSNIAKANQLVIKGFITKNHKIRVNFKEGDSLSTWSGKNLKGSGDSSTTYFVRLSEKANNVDLTKISATTFATETEGSEQTTLMVTSYIARNRGHEPHTTFKSESSGSLFLVDAENNILDSVNYSAVPVGTSWSRSAAGAWGIASPSPYGSTVGEVNAVQVSASEASIPPSGFYSQPLSLTFPAGTRCATGGVEPNRNSQEVTALNISSTTVLRCVTYADGAYPSDMVNRTYVFEQAPSIATLFVTTDPLSMFSPDSGLYMTGNGASMMDPKKGANFWSNRELPVFVEFFEPGKSQGPAFSVMGDYQISGQYSRAKEKKSFSVTLREEYGTKRLKYNLFPDYPDLKKFKAFSVRNFGNNCGNDYVRDRIGTAMTESLGLDYQRGRYIVVYYNGDYFGIHDLRERNNEYYYETHYGLDPDDIDLIDASNEASNGSGADFQAMIDWLGTNKLDNDANYNKVAEQIDVDNFMNYMQAEMFDNNRDWPHNNMKKWRVASQKTKWKWFVYDMDFGFGASYNNNNSNIFEYVTNPSGTQNAGFGMGMGVGAGAGSQTYDKSTILIGRLLENASFKNAFINRFCVLLTTAFAGDRLVPMIEKLQAEVQPEIARDQERWGFTAASMDRDYNSALDFATTRQQTILSEMSSYFQLSDMVAVTLNVEGSGSVLVHNLPIGKSANVNFFRGVPVTVTAVPENGSVFNGWSDGESAATRTFNPGEVTTLVARFK